MPTLSRRAFGKALLSLGAFPLGSDTLFHSPPTQISAEAIFLPERVAGYIMTEEERKLAAAFLTSHENNLQPLRVRELPNAVPPAFVFASPTPTKGEKDEQR